MRFRLRYCLLLLVLAVPLSLAYGVASIFFLSRDAAALRNSVLSQPGFEGAHKRIALHAGFFTTGAARLVSQWLKIPVEAHAAIDSVRGIEVGVYRLEQALDAHAEQAVMAGADKALLRRGWQKIVGVTNPDGLVAVYCPDSIGASKVRCCVLVVQGRDMVVAGVRANPSELIDLGLKKLESHDSPLAHVLAPRT